MESSERTTSTRLKQRAVIGFLTAEGVIRTDIHHHLQAVYGEGTIDRSTVNRWAIKFRVSELGKVSIEDVTRAGPPVFAALVRLKFEAIPHLPCLPDLAPFDFHFFPNLKRDLKEFLIDGMGKLVHHWEKCVAVNGDYVEK